VTRVILGHRSPVATEVYAEIDRERAVAVMEWIGWAAAAAERRR
jgi:hypothetical protein